MDYNVPSNKNTLTIPPLPNNTIRTYNFGLNMRPITISLDATTWELAKKKSNFSAWVRDQLRSERNKTEVSMRRCTYCYKTFPKKEFYDHVCITLEEGWDEE